MDYSSIEFKDLRELVRKAIRFSKVSQLKNSDDQSSGLGDLAGMNRLDTSLIDNLPQPPVTGQSTQSGNGTTTDFAIPHGLSATPTVWLLTVASAGARGTFHVEADATNLTVKYATAPASGTNNLIFNWLAMQPLV